LILGLIFGILVKLSNKNMLEKAKELAKSYYDQAMEALATIM